MNIGNSFILHCLLYLCCRFLPHLLTKIYCHGSAASLLLKYCKKYSLADFALIEKSLFPMICSDFRQLASSYTMVRHSSLIKF